VRFAGHGARLAAYLIDWMIQIAVAIAVFFLVGVFVTGAVASGSDAAGGAAVLGTILAGLGYLAFGLVYFPWFWSRSGRTPGMRAMGIKVVRDIDGGPITTGTAVMRLIGYWINSIVFYVGFAWILVDKRRRGWHDLIAGTCVIATED
jgi:uncharacterized RDD family membrane protein YckC